MTTTGVFFGGRRYVRSQAAARVDASRMAGFQVGSIRIPVILGDALGGEPGAILKLSSPSQARDILYGGDLLKGVEKAFAPSKTLQGAQEVWAIRLNPATQASKTLQDSVPANVLDITSRWYGKRANEVEIKIAAGTVSGKHVYLRHLPSGAAEDQDNLQDVLAIQYTGNGTAATMTITVTAGDAVTLATTLTGQTDGTQNLSIDLTSSSFDTVAKVVNYINGQQGYTATFSQYLKNQSLASKYLDAESAVDIKTAAHTITSDLGTIIDWINTISQLVTAEKNSATAVTAPDNIAWTALSGGAEGTTTAAEWTAALTLLEPEDVDLIVPLTTSESTQIMVANHVSVMRGVGRLRKAIYGHALSATAAEIKALALKINTEAGILCTPGIKDYDANGAMITYNSSFTACCLAGMNAGRDNVAVPLTGHLLNCLGLEKTYTDQEVDDLILGGVLPIRYEKNVGYEVALSTTTYLKDNNILYSEWSVSDIADFISQDMKKYLEKLYKGKPATKATVNTVKDDVESRLKAYERMELITSGVDRNTGEDVTAYRNIQIRYSSGAVYVDYEVSPVEPMNWILITTHAVSIDIVA